MRKRILPALYIHALLAVACILATVLPASVLSAQSSTKPSLTEEIRTVLEEDGPEAADRRFREIFPEHKDEWEIDLEALAKLGVEAMQSGDMAAGQAVMEMFAAVQQDMMASGGMALPTGAPQSDSGAAASERAARAADAPEGASATASGSASELTGGGSRLGPARDDLQRFMGEYGDDPLRRLFVTVSCTGHLVAGPTWGDTSPWWLTSKSDTEFTYSDSFTSIEITFRLSTDGEATALTHDRVDLLPTTLERHPLREGWEECVVPPWG